MPGFFKSIGNFLGGTPERRENVSTLRPEQEGLYGQLVGAGQGAGAGGAFGTSADYYRNILGNGEEDFNAFAAPQLRQYNQDIVPGLSEQFAGMGAGGLSSSGFRNAQMQGATDLAERLGAMRANLRQQGAQGLQNIGNLGLQNYSQNMVTEPGTQGFLSSVAPALGGAVGTALGGPMGGMIGAGLGGGVAGGLGGGGMGNWFGTSANQVGANTSPYSSNANMFRASPSVNFSQRSRYGG